MMKDMFCFLGEEVIIAKLRDCGATERSNYFSR